MKTMIPYGHQWVGEDDVKAVTEALKGDWLTQGPAVEKFEKAIAKYCGVKYGVAVSSGTAALHAAYTAAGIGPGDEVITTPLTFAGTANAVVYCGGTPVFADIDPETLNINPAEIEKKITKKTKAIAPVDFAGHPAEYDDILKLAKKHKLLVIEDAAHALGSVYKGKKIGSIADMTILSFHPVKTITTGEGGMVLTNSKVFAEKLKVFRHHGIKKKKNWEYEIHEPGYNYRLTDIQCALGLSQLKKLNRFIARRREIVVQYNRVFDGNKEKPYVKSAWHIYVIQVRNRTKVFEALRKRGIGVHVHYIPVHLQPFYKKKFGYHAGDFPAAEAYYKGAITLPLFPQMTHNDVQRVIHEVLSIQRS